MNLDWITDPHLDHLSSRTLIRFVDKLHQRDSDGLIITGDIAESSTIYDMLGVLSGAYQRPIYFVLGNHDFYGATMKTTKERVLDVCHATPPGILNWTSSRLFTHLKDQTGIVGCDGLYDGAGLDLTQPLVAMTDFADPQAGIVDFLDAADISIWTLLGFLQKLAQDNCAQVRRGVEAAVSFGLTRILILTHVPPFPESSFYRGKPTEKDALPWYSSRTLADELCRLATEFPNVSFEVYSGHTHGAASYQAAPNLVAHVGSAYYGRMPQFQPPITI